MPKYTCDPDCDERTNCDVVGDGPAPTHASMSWVWRAATPARTDRTKEQP